MSNFSDSVVYALGQLLDILQEADNAQSEIDDLQEYFSDISDQINEEWASLKDQIENLFNQAELLKANLEEQNKITATSLNAMQLKLKDLQEQYQQNQESTKSSLITFRESIEVSEDELSEVLEGSNYSLEELISQTQETEAELETALVKVDEFFTDVILNIIKNNLQQSEENFTQLQELIEKECIDAIEQNTDRLKLSLEEIADQLQEKMTLFKPLREKSGNYLSPLLDDYDPTLEQIINRLTVDGDDKQIQLEERNHLLFSALNDLDDNYINTREKALEVMALLNEALSLRKNI